MHKSSSLHRGAAPLAIMLLLMPTRSGHAVPPETPAAPLSLAQAFATAFDRSPALRAARAGMAVARADSKTAGTYPFNPVLDGAVGRRTGADVAGTDWGLALSQEIELAGQRGKRTAAASAELAAAESTFLHAGRLLYAEVESAYVEAVKSRELLRVERVDLDLARTYREHALKRLEAGAGTQIEDNLARVTLGRAERRLRAAEAASMEARTILAESMGLGVDPLPEPSDPFPDPPPEPANLSALLDLARENRADILAFAHATEAARARIELAGSEGRPNLTLGGFYDREGGGDEIVGANFGIAIPVFNRNQGGVALRLAELERTSAAQAGIELSVAREVAAAYHRLTAARAAVAGLRQDVIGSLEENLDLLQRSFAAGKIGATEVLIFRREFVEGQREYVEAQAVAWQTRVALDLAAGRVSLPSFSIEGTQP